MTFAPEQVKELQANLSRAHVKEREQAGRKFSYIEAYHAENEANRIFGFDAWDRFTELSLIGESLGKDKYGNDQHRVSYRARVRIVVRAGDTTVTREGCGYGSGIDKDLGQAHESALKEAESDAEKRALKTFGNPFGQALYDKKQSEVEPAAEPAPRQAAARAAPAKEPEVFSGAVLAAKAAIDLCTTEDQLNKWGTDNGPMIQSMEPPEASMVRQHYGKRLTVLRGEVREAA